jgi:hypothetical protein
MIISTKRREELQKLKFACSELRYFFSQLSECVCKVWPCRGAVRGPPSGRGFGKGAVLRVASPPWVAPQPPPTLSSHGLPPPPPPRFCVCVGLTNLPVDSLPPSFTWSDSVIRWIGLKVVPMERWQVFSVPGADFLLKIITPSCWTNEKTTCSGISFGSHLQIAEC